MYPDLTSDNIFICDRLLSQRRHRWQECDKRGYISY